MVFVDFSDVGIVKKFINSIHMLLGTLVLIIHTFFKLIIAFFDCGMEFLCRLPKMQAGKFHAVCY